ncbi:hypothetical protein AXF42_Ash014955 [Apostasia shenzhenica]|uniref:Uncharacterized protein n=1 Tax=Apostasia shenzhenica TaxID=1088818 RepID=A0A2I0ALK7_9ASPA|nr:hypothetical protein AXF42_Ash014955 [Apostasia shenzhenica]
MASFLLPSSLALLFLFVTAAAALRPTAVKRSLDLKNEAEGPVVDGLAEFAVEEVNQKRALDYEKANGQKMPPKDNFLYQKPLSAEVQTLGDTTDSFTIDIDVLENANTIHGSIQAVLNVGSNGELKLGSWKAN